MELTNPIFVTMEKDIRVAVFEDNYLLRDGYAQLINGMPGFICTGAFDNAADLIFKIKQSEPEVVLMDVEMPGISGIIATQIIKEQFPHIHIIIQTVFADDDKIFQAIQAGANGYILKKTNPIKILEAITDIMNGGAPITPSIAAKTLQLFRKQSPVAPSPHHEQLNERQKEILECIVAGMSYKLIAEKTFVSIDTVRYHVKNIYAILHVNSRYELLAKRGNS
jgi:DNA-binding NarL/FixJ family response regulator